MANGNGRAITDVFRFGPTFIDLVWERPALREYQRGIIKNNTPTYVNKKLSLDGSYTNGNGIEKIREDLKRFASGEYVLVYDTPETPEQVKNGIRVREPVSYANGNAVVVYSLNVKDCSGDIIIPGIFMKHEKDDSKPPMEMTRVYPVDEKGRKLIKRHLRNIGIVEDVVFW